MVSCTFVDQFLGVAIPTKSYVFNPKDTGRKLYLIWLVVWNCFYFSVYWEQSSQLTNILQRGRSTTNQLCIVNSRCNLFRDLFNPNLSISGYRFPFWWFWHQPVEGAAVPGGDRRSVRELICLFPYFYCWWFGTCFFLMTFHILGTECHNPNWRTPSFFRGIETTHQPVYIYILIVIFYMIGDFSHNLYWLF